MAAAVSIKGVGKSYRGREGSIEAIRDVSFEVREGEVVSLVGPSGCGKSTILKIVAGLTGFDRGSVEVGGRPPQAGSPEVGIMLQSPVLLPWRTVEQNVLLPTEIAGADRGVSRRRAAELLDLVGLGGFAGKYPSELSGGMRQRASLARLLVTDPDVLLLDEPFSALDEFTRERLTVELSRILGELGRSVLYVTHNIPEAVYLSDRVVVLSSHPGRVLGVVEVGLPRPRPIEPAGEPQVAGLVAEIRALVRPEVGLGGPS